MHQAIAQAYKRIADLADSIIASESVEKQHKEQAAKCRASMTYLANVFANDTNPEAIDKFIAVLAQLEATLNLILPKNTDLACNIDELNNLLMCEEITRFLKI